MSRSQTSQTLFAPNRRGKGQITTENKENIWSSLLDSVSTGKRLPEKSLIVLGSSNVFPSLFFKKLLISTLGGGSETQKEFLETLGTESAKRSAGRYRKRPSVANEFALGYTYQEVLDADQEGVTVKKCLRGELSDWN